MSHPDTSPLGEPTPLPPAIEALLDEYARKLRNLEYWKYQLHSDALRRKRDTQACDAARAALSTEIGKALNDAREDAERLDWLDDVTHQHQNPECCMGLGDAYFVITGKVRNREYVEGATLRAAIDAARRSTPSETPAAASRPPAPRTAQ